MITFLTQPRALIAHRQYAGSGRIYEKPGHAAGLFAFYLFTFFANVFRLELVMVNTLAFRSLRRKMTIDLDCQIIRKEFQIFKIHCSEYRLVQRPAGCPACKPYSFLLLQIAMLIVTVPHFPDRSGRRRRRPSYNRPVSRRPQAGSPSALRRCRGSNTTFPR